MPRIQAAAQFYFLARRATLPVMPALSSSFHGALCILFSDSTSVRPVSVCGTNNPHLPALDVIIRSNPANSPSTWDIYSETALSTRFSSRFLKSCNTSCESTSLQGPYSASILGFKVGRFSGSARGCSAIHSRSDSEQCSVASLGGSTNVTSDADPEDRGCLEVFEEGNHSENGEISPLVKVSSGEAKDPVGRESSISEEARGGSPDRRRRGTPSRSAPPEWRDLLTVPGIGPRNMEKLVAKGIAKLDELKQLYREKYWSDGTEKMVEFLRSAVGVQKHHATRISVFLKNSVDSEENRTTESAAKSKKRLTFCVEGNISVGKTTFLHRIANETVELRDLVEVVPEPIGKWQDVGPDHFNILDAFYGDPKRYAYTFQNYVFVTRMMQERESATGDKRLRLMERSVFSDRMVFVRAVHEAKWMSDAEISIYDSWFDPVVSAMPGLIPDAFIYLRATPDTCLRRLQSRNREEETNVTLDYLRGLHEKHEQWLFPAESTGRSVVSVSQWPDALKGPLSPRLQDRVLYLQGDNVHSSIQKVPALVLDCEPSIDFSKDVDAKAEYARQVAEFFEYVQSMSDVQPQRQETSPLLLPREGGLLGPNGRLLRSDTVSLDLRRQISVCA